MTDLQRAVLGDVSIPTGPGGTPGLRGVLGTPEGSGPWPGVVLLHETFGVDGAMRRQVQRMAAAGYLALMPDLFTDGGARGRLVPTFKAVAAGEGRPFLDVEAARAHLAAMPDCTGHLSVLGSSVGGGLALQGAARGFDAAAVNCCDAAGGYQPSLTPGEEFTVCVTVTVRDPPCCRSSSTPPPRPGSSSSSATATATQEPWT